MSSAAQSPLVSVVVRSMARPSLDAALASLARQDYPRVEVVVVSACGASHPPLAHAAGRHPLRLVAGTAPRNRPQAANAGQDAARGTWITFLDDDDTLAPTHLAGLVDALGRANGARVVHSLAVVAGSDQLFGQPCAPVELYQRNFIQMSTALWSRTLVADGCRFDESLPIHEDWDFFLQCAQHTRFHFEPHATACWNAAQGESGAFGAGNFDAAEFARVRDRVYAKWQPQYDALVAAIMPLLERAGAAAARHDFATAQRLVDEVFAVSPDDPSALNLRAMIERAQGRLDAAQATQMRSVSLRPADHALAFNLALLLRARGDYAGALRYAQSTTRLAPGFAPAHALVAELAGSGRQ